MPRGSRQVKSIQNYIDGKFVGGKREFADANPADGSVIAQVSEADRDLVDAAVQAARRALRGEWGRLGVRERAGRLHKVADAIERRFDCFVAAEVADTGKPIALASKLDVAVRSQARAGVVCTSRRLPSVLSGTVWLASSRAL